MIIEQEHACNVECSLVVLCTSIEANARKGALADTDVRHLRKVQQERLNASLQDAVRVDLWQELEGLVQELMQSMFACELCVFGVDTLLVDVILLYVLGEDDASFGRPKIALCLAILLCQPSMQQILEL